MKTINKTLGINLVYNPTGGSLEQIKKIFENIELYEFNKFVIYVTPNNLNLVKRLKSKNVRIRVSSFAGNNLITRTIWEQCFLPIYLIIDRVSIVFCPGNIAPILSLTKKAQWIGTIGPFEKEFVKIYAEYSLWKRFVLFINKFLMLYSSKTSDHVFFESFYTRDMFIRRYKLNKKRTSVLQIGRDEFFKPVKEIHNDKYSELLKKKFFLSVSHLYPYKNIETLIHTFNRLKEVDKDLYLVLAGSTQNIKYLEKLNNLISYYNLENSINFLGNLNREELKLFYSKCYSLVFTSPFENFAYTLVEAMSCGAPIICTNTTAMPETCKKAALYFDPYDIDQLFTQSKLLLIDESLREYLIKESLVRANELDNYKNINIKTSKVLNMIS